MFILYEMVLKQKRKNYVGVNFLWTHGCSVITLKYTFHRRWIREMILWRGFPGQHNISLLLLTSLL